MQGVDDVINWVSLGYGGLIHFVLLKPCQAIVGGGLRRPGRGLIKKYPEAEIRHTVRWLLVQGSGNYRTNVALPKSQLLLQGCIKLSFADQFYALAGQIRLV